MNVTCRVYPESIEGPVRGKPFLSSPSTFTTVAANDADRAVLKELPNVQVSYTTRADNSSEQRLHNTQSKRSEKAVTKKFLALSLPFRGTGGIISLPH
jgi:hypothetical protein